MSDTLLVILCVLAALLTGFAIPVLLELRNTLRRTNSFIDRTEKDLEKALSEFDSTMKSVKGVSDDIAEVTSTAKGFTRSFSASTRNIQSIMRDMDMLSSASSGRILGLRAAVLAAVGVIADHLLSKAGRRDKNVP